MNLESFIKLPVKRLTKTAKLPERKHDYDAGWDLFVDLQHSLLLSPGETVVIKTGIAVAVPPGYELQIRTRSGMAAKRSLCLLNSPGTVDCGYLGDLSLIVHNAGGTFERIEPGERLGQMVLNKIPDIQLEEVEELPVYGNRGEKGIGSSGK